MRTWQLHWQVCQRRFESVRNIALLGIFDLVEEIRKPAIGKSVFTFNLLAVLLFQTLAGTSRPVLGVKQNRLYVVSANFLFDLSVGPGWLAGFSGRLGLHAGQSIEVIVSWLKNLLFTLVGLSYLEPFLFVLSKLLLRIGRFLLTKRRESLIARAVTVLCPRLTCERMEHLVVIEIHVNHNSVCVLLRYAPQSLWLLGIALYTLQAAHHTSTAQLAEITIQYLVWQVLNMKRSVCVAWVV